MVSVRTLIQVYTKPASFKLNTKIELAYVKPICG